jgi:hypothetical protein
MRFFIAAAVMIVAATPATAAKFGLILKPGPEQSLRMQDGIGALDSHTQRSSLRIAVEDEPIKKRGTIHVLVLNHGPNPFNFGAENFSATTGGGTAVQIITYDQLRREEKHRQTWRRIAAGFAAAGNSMNASNAGYSSGYGSFSGNTYGAYGSSQTYGTATWTTYDPARAQAAQSIANAENQRMFANLADRNAAGLASIKGTMRTTTVDPNTSFGGALIFELPDAARNSKVPVPVTFTISVDGETHTVEAVLTPR